MELTEILRALDALPVDEQEKLKREVLTCTKDFRWTPNPGPQTEAYNSKADVVLYAGSAGSGKSQLALGLATQEHTRAIIFRREAAQTDGLIADAKLMLGDSVGFNGQHLEFSWGKGKSLKLAGMKELTDWRKHAGRERDLIVYDEAAEFLQEQVQSSFGWLRGPPGQRCRILLPSNPPRDSDGFWILQWFSPWFDEAFLNPAKCGELRWAIMDGDKTIWVDGPEPIEINGQMMIPHSRTFIRAMLKDNPYRNTDEYRAKLMMTPEPLRSQLLYGDFSVGQEDKAWQCIPSKWIREAQARWTPTPPPGVPMCAMAIDVAQGGADQNVMALRHDGWFAPLIVIEGSKTPLGTDIAGWIISKRRDNAKVIIDVGGGYGSVPYTTLKDNGIDVVPYKGQAKTNLRAQGNVLGFYNKRSEVYWRFRESLDPSQPGGSTIALPPDAELVSDLASLEYKTTSGKIQVTPKEELVKRLGRSTDCFVAGTMVATPVGGVPIEQLRVGDEVVTPYGTRKIIAVHKQEAQNITTAYYNGKPVLTGKPGHRVFTWDEGWVRLCDLTEEHHVERLTIRNLVVWRSLSLWFTKGRNSGFKHQVDTIALAGKLTRKDFFIEEFGRTLSDVSQKGFIFTTLTETGKTIGWRILRLLKVVSTCKSICLSGLKTLSFWKKLAKTSVRPLNMLLHGTLLQKVLRGTQKLGRKVGLAANQLRVNVRSAVNGTWQEWQGRVFAFVPVCSAQAKLDTVTSQRSANFVGKNSLLSSTGPSDIVQKVAPQRLDKKNVGTVYDITLDEDNVYYANGILVENCGDAVVMCYSQGQHAVTDMVNWGEQYAGVTGKYRRFPRVLVGHPETKRYSYRH